MMLFAGLMSFGFIFPSAFAIIMRIVSITFLIPLAVFGTGFMAWFFAIVFGSAEWTMSSYLTYCLIFGTIPGLITTKVTLIG